MSFIKDTKLVFEDASPNPEFLIKSIAEQGYSLETALADLMDNSISADSNRIEILIDFEREPFTLYLADNGWGMDEKTLKSSMQFPSKSSEEIRNNTDLGRFGLGMKTASFSQTRKFTVISRKKGTEKYHARTWDVEFLKKIKKWNLIIPSQKEISQTVDNYKKLSENHLCKFENFKANTIIVWEGLYKFENYIEEKNRQVALKKQITEITSDYLSLVFHRFMEKNNPLMIRINNQIIKPFNPFPTHLSDFRPIEYKQKRFSTDQIKIEGFILPSKSIDESNKGLSHWTTKNKGLMDMEGIYVYRSDRIILFGGWNGLIKKTPRLQLARLRVEVGNSVDHLLHLNVAKSQIVIPHDLKNAFEKYVEDLKLEAEKEFFNRGVKDFSSNKNINNTMLFERKASSKGMLLELNYNYPILKSLLGGLSKEQASKLNILVRMINTRINKIRQVQEDEPFIETQDSDKLSTNDIIDCIKQLKKDGFSTEYIKSNIILSLGYKDETYPDRIKKILAE